MDVSEKDCSIEIGISTLNDGLYNIVLSCEFCYVIIHQVTNGCEDTYESYFNENLNRNGVKYIQSSQPGLSRSRNLFLAYSKADYLWVMDDDVRILNRAASKITEFIHNNPFFDLVLLNYTTNENCYDAFECASKRVKIKKWFEFFDVCSINMLINGNVYRKHGLTFNEKFGLGTQLPSGEEFIFTNEVFQLNRKIIQSNLVVSFHPPETSGLDFYSSDQKLRAKRIMFSEVYGAWIGYMLFLLFSLKKMKVIIRGKALVRLLRIAFEKS